MRILGYDVGVIESLIFINVAVFLVFSTTQTNFIWAITNLALTPSDVFERPWTLITSMFVHSRGYDHIVFNMFSLYFFGIYLLQLVGEKDILKIYFLGGIVGGLFFVATSLLFGEPDPSQSAVGASGAIFALGAALAIMRPKMTVFLFPIPIPMPLYIAVFGVMVIMSFISLSGQAIAWQAHMGGLLVGIIYGMMFAKKEPLSGHLYGYYNR